MSQSEIKLPKNLQVRKKEEQIKGHGLQRFKNSRKDLSRN